MTPEELLETATARHRAGDLREARLLYQRLLVEAPRHAVALLRSGLLELQDGRPETALRLIEQARAIAPGDPRHDAALGQVLQTLGRCAEAASAFRRVLDAEPHSADAFFGLGVSLQSLGQYEEAIAAYEGAVEFQADFFAALNNLGNCLQRQARLPEAEAAYARALALRPGEVGAMANLGTVLQGMGRIDEAIALLRAAVAAQPLVTAHAVNLGIALCRRHDFAAAQAVLRAAFDRDATSADAAFNLGNALYGLRDVRAAADAYQQAIALHPLYADAIINLGNMHRELGEFAAATAAYETAIQAQPDSVIALNNLGCLLRTLGRYDAAEAAFHRGLALDPDNAAIYDNLGSVLKDAGDIDAAIASFRRSVALNPDNPETHGNLAYALCFQSLKPQAILDECLRWNARFAAALRPRVDSHPNKRSPDRRLRIGYVSPDFRDHCQSLFTVPLLAHHDHSAFEIFCYASVARPDDLTRRLMQFADSWRDVCALDDDTLAALIRDDGIDILVDLTMHMAGARPLVFARKPAPLQIAWLAYPGTTGMTAMDFRLSDARLDPAGYDDHYTERTVRLADSFWCYDPLCESPAVNALPAIERGDLTLGCLNNPCKLTDSTLDLWAQVMNALPHARLRLMAPPGIHRSRLLQRLAVRNIDAARVSFVPFQIRSDYLRTYHDIDIGLDTFPYNGHTTSLDAYWMGVPTVTRVGDTCVGRGGLSQTFQLNLPQLAAATDAAFVSAVVTLASDLPRLAALRRTLRSRLQRSPLMDGPRFAGNVEAVYRKMWRAYCSGSAERMPQGRSAP
jgi:protein O-GlcNAc transferase